MLWSSEDRRKLFDSPDRDFLSNIVRRHHTRSRMFGLSDVRSDFSLRNSNLLNELNPQFLLIRLVLLVSPPFGVYGVISSSESHQYH